MVFSSQIFIYLLFPALLILYYLWNNITWRNCVLLCTSLLFYGWGEPIYILLMIAVVALNYASGMAMEATKTQKARKTVLAISVILNLCALGFYKYAPMIVETLNFIPAVNLEVPPARLPLGISFFTFQALSYTIDVYRRDVAVQKNFTKVLLYISLFPQLVAGPIVQYGDVAEAINHRTESVEEFCEGAYRFAIGLARKVLLADACGAVATFYLTHEAEKTTVLGMWVGMIFFALQIYYDFSGYSDMAIGLGHMFGFTFLENFNYPYISLSAGEFWRRWHISLGTFFREYVYIPLGGNRRHQYRNLLIVWFLTGLWHGASWNFVIWGLYYGVLLLFERKLLFPFYKKIGVIASSMISVVYMFLVTVVGWTIFYYEDGLEFARRIGMLFGGGNIPASNFADESYLMSHIFLLAVALFFAFPVLPALLRKIKSGIKNENAAYATRRIAMTVCVLVLVFLATARLTGNTYSPFIYSHF